MLSENARVTCLFLACLALHTVIILTQVGAELHGDELRYLDHVHRLIQGSYTSANNPNVLRNGPGYPMLLRPFVLIDAPVWLMRLLNAVFTALAVTFFYKTVRIFASERAALVSAGLFGLYPPLLLWMTLLYSEALATLLMCIFAYSLTKMLRKQTFSWGNFFVSALALAGLALTKTLFGYVIVIMLFLTLVLWFYRPTAQKRTAVLIFSMAIGLCVPYLAHTHTLTGKHFYWGSNGGEMLYWMASPYPGELGTWFSKSNVRNSPDLSAHHLEFYREIEGLPAIARDQAFKSKAKEFLREEPTAYLRHWFANVGRLFFNSPYTARKQSLGPYFYLLPNLLLLLTAGLSIVAVIMARWTVPFDFVVLGLLSVIFCGLSSLLPAVARFFIVIAPLLMLWITYVLTNLVHVEIGHTADGGIKSSKFGNTY